MTSRTYISARKVLIEESTIRFVDRKHEFSLEVSKIYRFGVERRFSRLLILLLVFMALITLITSNIVYLILTFITLSITIISKEEYLVIVYGDETTVVKGLTKRELNNVLNHLEKIVTH